MGWVTIKNIPWTWIIRFATFPVWLNQVFSCFYKSEVRLSHFICSFQDTEPVKLYLRLPVKIVDENQVKNLHPAIVKVTLPRQVFIVVFFFVISSNRNNFYRSLVVGAPSSLILLKNLYVNFEVLKSLVKGFMSRL